MPWIIVGIFSNGDETEMPIMWNTKEEAEKLAAISSQLTPADMRTEIRQVAANHKFELVRRKRH